jgi:hypothetical protein
MRSERERDSFMREVEEVRVSDRRGCRSFGKALLFVGGRLDD